MVRQELRTQSVGVSPLVGGCRVFVRSGGTVARWACFEPSLWGFSSSSGYVGCFWASTGSSRHGFQIRDGTCVGELSDSRRRSWFSGPDIRGQTTESFLGGRRYTRPIPEPWRVWITQTLSPAQDTCNISQTADGAPESSASSENRVIPKFLE